jgi:small subunit ribosomal protein S21
MGRIKKGGILGVPGSRNPDTHKGGLRVVPVVKVRDNESLDKALRRLKKKLDKEGILKQMKRHEHYEKPSQRKRRKLLKSKRRDIS